MLSSNNILKPADGRPVTMPTQDMIIGLFHLTSQAEFGKGSYDVDVDEDGTQRLRAFGSVAEARMAFDAGQIALGTPIRDRDGGGVCFKLHRRARLEVGQGGPARPRGGLDGKREPGRHSARVYSLGSNHPTLGP